MPSLLLMRCPALLASLLAASLLVGVARADLDWGGGAATFADAGEAKLTQTTGLAVLIAVTASDRQYPVSRMLPTDSRDLLTPGSTLDDDEEGEWVVLAASDKFASGYLMNGLVANVTTATMQGFGLTGGERVYMVVWDTSTFVGGKPAAGSSFTADWLCIAGDPAQPGTAFGSTIPPNPAVSVYGSQAAYACVQEVDLVPPTVVLSTTEPSPTNASLFRVTIAFSETVSGLAVGDLVIGNGSATNLVERVVGKAWTADITADEDGPVTVDLPAGAAQDTAGNDCAAAVRLSRTYDGTIPVIAVNPAAVTLAYNSPAPDLLDGVSATDSLDGDLTSGVVTDGTVNPLVMADYTVNYDVADSAGNSALTKSRVYHVIKAAQSITFAPLPGKTYGDDPFPLTATASSNLAVTFASSNLNVVTVAEDKGVWTATIVGAGNATITASQSGNANWEAATSVGRQLAIARKPLTVNGAAAQNKVYDGTDVAAITGAVLAGVVDGDDVALAGSTSGTFAQSDVGTGIRVTTAMTLGGDDAGNYTLAQPTGLVADITAKALTVTGAAAQNKVYDGTDVAAITGAVLVGAVDGDDLTLADHTAGTFAQSNIGTGIAVSTAMTLDGDDAGNYTLAQPAGLVADITAKALTVTGATAQDKVYDGTNVTVITGAALVGVVDGDDVSLAGSTSGIFAQSDIGTGIAVTTAMTLDGDDAGNYTLAQPTGLVANITAKALTVTGATVQDKVYDSTNVALITGAALVGVMDGDDVTLADHTTGTFAQSDVGTGIAVTTAMTLDGDDAGNYTLTQPAALTADITAKALTVTGATAQDKVYDGTDAAVIKDAVLVGAVGGDDVVLADHTMGTFTQPDAGKTIAVTTAMMLDGDDAANYTLAQPAGLAADITPKALTVTGATAQDKVYDGTNTATIVGGNLVGVVGNDSVTLENHTTGTFAQSDVGMGVAIATAMGLGGDDEANYTLRQPTGLAAEITPKTLTVTGAMARNKAYDGTDAAIITGAALAGVLGDDDVSLANHTAGTFAQAEIGTDIEVTTEMTLSGAGTGNYTLAQPAGLVADIIDPALAWVAELTVTGVAAGPLTIGMHAAATDGWDPGLDVAGEVQAHLASDDLALCYSTDFRASADSADFLLIASADDDTPATISWDVLDLPVDRYLTIYEVLLADTRLRGSAVPRSLIGGTALNLAVPGAIEIPAGETRSYVLHYGPELVYDLALAKGWDAVSLPIEPLDPTVAAVLDDGLAERGTVHSGDVWGWQGQQYEEVAEMHACAGYWVFTSEPTILLVEGLPVDQDGLVLDDGWNFCGVTMARAIPGDARLTNTFWLWEADSLRYRPVTELLPGRGYWIRAEDDSTMPFPTR